MDRLGDLCIGGEDIVLDVKEGEDGGSQSGDRIASYFEQVARAKQNLECIREATLEIKSPQVSGSAAPGNAMVLKNPAVQPAALGRSCLPAWFGSGDGQKYCFTGGDKVCVDASLFATRRTRWSTT